MPHFMVFGGRKYQNVMGVKGITWELIGVFEAADENTACLVGAQKAGVGTTFAVEGTAWGVDTVKADETNELGVEADPITRLERMGNKIAERLASALPAAKQHELEAGDDGHE